MATILAPRRALTASMKRSAWVPPTVLVGALTAVVTARWLATRLGLDGLAVGAGFGLALTAVWLLAARIPRRHVDWAFGPPAASATRRITLGTAAGLGFGLVLVAVAVSGPSIAGGPVVPGLGRPAAAFLPWALITLIVATAEEGILRGVLFDRLQGVGGTPAAVVLTTIGFALLHVPLYGWHVVPLDIAVGLGLAGLRLSTRTVVAPAIAHGVADLATWWL